MIVEKLTGIVYETETDENVIESMILINEQLKALDDVKKQLRDIMMERDLSGREHNGRVVRISNTQRKIFDKAIMRRVFDEDLYDTFMKPDNKAVKEYIKENLETLGDASTELSKNMIPDGRPYTTVKVERLER